MEDPKEIIENIRLEKFGIGSSYKNPLAVDMHEAITHLAAELYQKDLHFVMELLQNADDNTYAEDVVPEIEFVLVEADVAGVGARWTLLVLNNELGFSKENVLSLCSIGRSTKKGRRDSGYIGEKGIGFKSVFLVTRHPIVVSNGFRIRFNDTPTDDTDIGYIVPEWAERPSTTELMDCLSVDKLPNTIVILPIRDDKVQALPEQLHQLSPRLVLFLKKIQKLSTRQHSTYSQMVSRLSSQGMSVQRKINSSKTWSSMIPNNCEFSLVHLSSKGEAVYFVWQQEFPVKPEHSVERRQEVETWMITLAFAKQLSGNDAQGEPGNLHAFLPSKLSTGFPFILNADFLLVSSRETLYFDSPWNRGILSCVSEAFMAAFLFLMKAFPAEIRHLYSFVPTGNVMSELAFIREAILEQLRREDVILCDTYVGQDFSAEGRHFLCRPSLARTVASEFRELLEDACKEGVQLPGLLRSHNIYIVDQELQSNGASMLSMLGVKGFTEQNYVDCISSPGWLLGLSDSLYVKVLCFLSSSSIDYGKLRNVPLFKYVDHEGNTKLLAASDKESCPVFLSQVTKDRVFILEWTRLFERWVPLYFMPARTIREIKNAEDSSDGKLLVEWLEKTAKIDSLSVESYGSRLVSRSREEGNAQLALNTIHFFLQAVEGGYMKMDACRPILSGVALLGASGVLCNNYGIVLLPSSVSLWPKLVAEGSWPKLVPEGSWPKRALVFLSERYLFELPSCIKQDYTSGDVVSFLRRAIAAQDIFDMQHPPDVALSSIMDAPWTLTPDILHPLLKWLSGLPYIPPTLLGSVKHSEWVKTIQHGYMQPSRSFLDLGGWRSILESKDVPFVDNHFYRDLKPYRRILDALGMVTTVEKGASAVDEHMRHLARTVLEVESSTAIRWYSYLKCYNWFSVEPNSLAIWVPDYRGTSCNSGRWRRADECVIGDSGDLFGNRLAILDRHYDDNVLLFLERNLGVAKSPGVEKYCQLWMEWGDRQKSVSQEECGKAWSVIARGWKSCNRKVANSFKERCWVPCEVCDDSMLVLARPDEVLYPDDLVLAEIFHKAYPSPKFAWYPRSAKAASWVEDLVVCYGELGVKALSEETRLENDASVSVYPAVGNNSGGILRLGSNKGLCRAILGFMANPKLGVSAQTRKKQAMLLKAVELQVVENAGEVRYKVEVGGRVCEATREALVRWEKSRGKIYVAISNITRNDVGAQPFELLWKQELAREVAKGVVGAERVLLAKELEKLLLLAACFDFDDNAVKLLLQMRNLRMPPEDEALLFDLA